MKIGMLVEGETDRGALPPIVSKLLGREVSPKFVYRKGGFQGLMARKKFEGYVRAYGHLDVELVIVVVDNDRRPAGERRSVIESRIPSDVRKPVVIGIAVEMLEAWLIACPEAFEDSFGRPVRLKKKPEEYQDPKREVVNRFLEDNTMHRVLTRELARRIVDSGHWDADKARRECPSLDDFFERLSNAVGESPAD